MNSIAIKYYYTYPKNKTHKVTGFNLIDFFHITVLFFQIYIYLYAISSVKQYILFCDNRLLKSYKLRKLAFTSGYF